jgi:hypothetical protein
MLAGREMKEKVSVAKVIPAGLSNNMKSCFGLAATIPNAKSEIHCKAKVMRALSAHRGQAAGGLE